jgi:hypothetical protein
MNKVKDTNPRVRPGHRSLETVGKADKAGSACLHDPELSCSGHSSFATSFCTVSSLSDTFPAFYSS